MEPRAASFVNNFEVEYSSKRDELSRRAVTSGRECYRPSQSLMVFRAGHGFQDSDHTYLRGFLDVLKGSRVRGSDVSRS